MPSPTTALELIQRSLRLAKILASEETPTAAEAQDALATLNDVLENWSTESLSVWGSADESFTLTPGQASYTVGPSGQFNTARPVQIDGGFTRLQGVDYPLRLIGQLEFNDISLKSQQQPIPELMLYVNENPLGILTLWPVPSQASQITLSIQRVLSQVPTLATNLVYPPGATKALRYALAVELCIEYGVPIDAGLASIAADSKADYKRANKVPVLARYDLALTGARVARDWRTG
jgi:hypothetical protein